MFVKLLTGVMVCAAVGLMLTGRREQRAPGIKAAPKAPRVPRAQDLVQCARCGVWLPADTRCDCAAG